MFNKIGLGTAQWGMEYGINNVTGKTKLDDIGKIIDNASSNAINFDILC